jgi:hypothetical protein
MKKLTILALVVCAGLVVAITACKSEKLGGTVEGESVLTEGWVDDNTFRIAAAGVPKKNITNIIQRKETAKRAATLNAMYQIIEKFCGSKIEGAAGMEDYELTGIAVSQELKATLRAGSVKKSTWDEEQNCEVIYEVKATGLKKKQKLMCQ